MNYDGRQKSLSVLRQTVRAGQAGWTAAEDVLCRVPESAEEREQQAFQQDESGLLVREIRCGKSVAKGAS